MKFTDHLQLMQSLPQSDLPTDEPLILASGSPRRAQLLKAAGYEFLVQPASDEAECGLCSRETAPELVARYAYRKAADVALKIQGKNKTGLVIGADTVASVYGQILGKPTDQQHAESMLRRLSGRRHDVYTGVCVWSVATNRCVVEVVRTELKMKPLTDSMLANYLESMMWEGKAGAFGFQDGNDWLEIVDSGSESNVVGLPMERLAEIFADFDTLAKAINPFGENPPLSK
ncbi:Maf-like protein YhdE [Planctomycetes bacterium CA13]|uniref:dTTP/UTP pyrophosphatase n=1 Tax=Novipirellula herctigrandis TaxID=2527986 RepID=A0A5C5YW93_9BACT|nr:Maf-like protein YhdE [Planctomycetes bacterium CA13]